MISRTWQLIFAPVVALATLVACSSANTPEPQQSSAEAPVDTPTQSSSQSSPTAGSADPSTSAADGCVAPAGAALQDQDPDDNQAPWKRNGPGKVVINFETGDMPAEWVPELERGVAAWNRSACLDTRLVETCESGTNCVTVSVGGDDDADGNFDAVESGGFTTGGHIDISNSLTGGERTNVTIHEMGHAVGLAHRLTEGVLMNGDTYEDVFDPDEIDFQNLLVLYGGQE